MLKLNHLLILGFSLLVVVSLIYIYYDNPVKPVTNLPAPGPENPPVKPESLPVMDLQVINENVDNNTINLTNCPVMKYTDEDCRLIGFDADTSETNFNIFKDFILNIANEKNNPACPLRARRAAMIAMAACINKKVLDRNKYLVPDNSSTFLNSKGDPNVLSGTVSLLNTSNLSTLSAQVSNALPNTGVNITKQDMLLVWNNLLSDITNSTTIIKSLYPVWGSSFKNASSMLYSNETIENIIKNINPNNSDSLTNYMNMIGDLQLMNNGTCPVDAFNKRINASRIMKKQFPTGVNFNYTGENSIGNSSVPVFGPTVLPKTGNSSVDNQTYKEYCKMCFATASGNTTEFENLKTKVETDFKNTYTLTDVNTYTFLTDLNLYNVIAGAYNNSVVSKITNNNTAIVPYNPTNVSPTFKQFDYSAFINALMNNDYGIMANLLNKIQPFNVANATDVIVYRNTINTTADITENIQNTQNTNDKLLLSSGGQVSTGATCSANEVSDNDIDSVDCKNNPVAFENLVAKLDAPSNKACSSSANEKLIRLLTKCKYLSR